MTQETQGLAPIPASVAYSDPGKIRSNNEDRYALPPDLAPAALRTERGHLYIVADGMGGHSAGEVAAELAIRVIPERFYNDADASEDAPAFDVAASLKAAIAEAAEGIKFEQMLSRERAQMGTTVVAAVVRGGELWVANVGDSRCYRLRDGALELLSLDHAWVAEQIRAGILTPEQGRDHPQRSALTRALGHPISAEPAIQKTDFRPGDRLMLCSDGLWECVDDETIAGLLRQPDENSAARSLIAAALNAGGPDNVTVMIIDASAAAIDVAPTAQFSKVDALAPTTRLPPVTAVAGATASAQTAVVAAATPAVVAAAPARVEVVTPKSGMLSRMALPVAGFLGLCVCLALAFAAYSAASNGGLTFFSPPPTVPVTRAAAATPTATTPPTARPATAATPTAGAAAPTVVASGTVPTATQAASAVPTAASSSSAPLGPSAPPTTSTYFPNTSVGGSGTPTATAVTTRTQPLAPSAAVTSTAPLSPGVATSTTLVFPNISTNQGAFADLKSCTALVAGACVASETTFARGTRQVYVSWTTPLPVGTRVRVEWLLNGKPKTEANDSCTVTATGCNLFVTRTSALLTYVTAIPSGVWTYQLYADDRKVQQGEFTVR